MIEFKSALPEDSDILSSIALESKGHWGYSREQLELWRNDLRISKDYIRKNIVRTIGVNSEIIGFFAITTKHECELEHFWMLPHVIGKGIGKRAFSAVVDEFRERGIPSFNIVSDPNAEGFYLHQGAVRIGEVPSIPQGRLLPKLRFVLD